MVLINLDLNFILSLLIIYWKKNRVDLMDFVSNVKDYIIVKHYYQSNYHLIFYDSCYLFMNN